MLKRQKALGGKEPNNMRCPKCSTFLRFLCIDTKGRRMYACDTHGQQYAYETDLLRPWNAPTAWMTDGGLMVDTFTIFPTLVGSQVRNAMRQVYPTMMRKTHPQGRLASSV